MTHQSEKRIEEIHRLITQQTILVKEHMTLVEASVYLGISKSYLYKLTSRKEIPFYRPGTKLIYFKKSDLDAWILSSRESSKSEIQELFKPKKQTR